MNIYDKMGFRLLLLPTLMVLIGMGLMVFFNSLFSQVHPTGMYAGLLMPILEMLHRWLYWGSLAIMAVGTLWLAINISRLMSWYIGLYYDGNQQGICPHCGGMVTQRNGHYGPYVKCLACGTNTSMR